MAVKSNDKNEFTDETNVEFEPDFDIVQMPIDELSDIGVDKVEKVPDFEANKPLIDIKKKQEVTRSTFTIIFLVGFISLLLAGLILGFFMDGNQLDNTKEILLTISGILSGPLGFVVGYYFRSSEQ